MIPLIISPVRIAAAVAISCVIGFGTGWKVNGWRKGAEVATAKAERYKDRADQAQAALDDLTTAAAKIRTAADGYTSDVATLSTKLDALRKDFKNAKPLPVDCRPDDFRVRHMGAAVDAANKAATGQ